MLTLRTQAVLMVCILSFATESKADANDLPKTIIAITSDQRSVQPIDWNSLGYPGYQAELSVLNLDSVQSIEQRLGKGLPNDEKRARAVIEERIAEIGRAQLDMQLREAYLPLGTMMAYGLDRYPVIIFDQQAVIYGVTDLAQAIDQYRQWREDQQGVTINE